MLLLWRPSIFSSLSPLSQTHCSPVTHTDVKTNTTDKQPKANTLTHTINRDMSNPLLFTLRPSSSTIATHTHIAANISHELSATSPSWIFIKQNSKQIDFTPAALLHFYLILSLIRMLTCSSLALLHSRCSILSFFSFFSWCFSTSFIYFLPAFSLFFIPPLISVLILFISFSFFCLLSFIQFNLIFIAPIHNKSHPRALYTEK